MDRHRIERRDFPTGRRGYDPAAVDEHLRRVADEFEARAHAPAPSLAASTSEQVRQILEAAERGASDLRTAAGTEAGAHVTRVQEAADGMLTKLDALETELSRLMTVLRTSAERLTEGLAELQSEAAAGLSADERQVVRAEPDEADSRPSPLAPAADASPAPPPLPAAAPAPPAADDSPAAPAPPAAADDPPPPPAPADDSPAASAPAAADDSPAAPAPAPAAAAPPAADDSPAPLAPADDDDSSPPATDSPPLSAPDAPDWPVPTGDTLFPEEGEPEPEDAGARLIALNMALNGSPRDDTRVFLEEHFDLPDVEALLDDVYARAGR